MITSLNCLIDFREKFRDIGFSNPMVTIFQVLHHIPDFDLKNVLLQLSELIPEGGHILLKEHDCQNEFDRLLIDLQHVLYGILNDECYLHVENGYKTAVQWKELFKTCGFEPVSEAIECDRIAATYVQVFRKIQIE